MKRLSWKNPPIVTVVSGTEPFMRSRVLLGAKAGANMTGRTVDRVDGKDSTAVATLLAESGGFFDSGGKLLIVDNPEKLDAGIVLDHIEEGDDETVIVLHCAGAPKGAVEKILPKIPKQAHLKFDAPPPWKAQEHAIAFCVSEAKRYGCKLDSKVAATLIVLVGASLAILATEIEKLCRYAKAKGSTTPSVDHLAATAVRLTEADRFTVSSALARRDPRSLMRALATVERSTAGDPTLPVCGIVAKIATGWLHAALVRESGVNDPEDIASTVGIHPFRFKKEVLPVLARWPSRDLLALLRGVAKSQRAVRSGDVSPWVGLLCALENACRTHPDGVRDRRLIPRS